MKELEKYITDEKTGLKYELVGDYYYPCFKAPESPKVGRFGMMYHDYLRNHKRVTYSGLMLSRKLKEHIEDNDRQAEEMLVRLLNKMAKDEGVIEQLKLTDRLKCAGLMNNIRNCSEEIVKSEVVFA